jgi:hypothetical protein
MNEWLALQNIQKGTIGPGGMCEVLAVPQEQVLFFPGINPQTQTLTDSIQLKADMFWFAFSITSKSRALVEEMQVGKSGVFFKQSVSGILTGQNISNHLQLENMVRHRWIVLARERSTGITYIIGRPGSAASLSLRYNSKQGTITDIIFSNDSKTRALIYGGIYSVLPGGRAETFLIKMLVEFRIGDPGRAAANAVQMIIPELANKPKIALFIDGGLISQQGYPDTNACTYIPAENKINTTFQLGDRAVIQVYEVQE